MSSRIKELATNTALFSLANFGSKILVFLMVPLYTTVLSTSEYGIANIVQTTGMMLFPILTISIADAVLRFSYIKELDTRKVFSVGMWITILSVLIVIPITLFFSYLDFFREIGIYIIFIPLYFLGEAVAKFLNYFARGIGKVKVSATYGLLNTFLLVGFNLLFLLYFKLGVTGYLLSFVLSYLFSSLYVALRCKVWRYAVLHVESGMYKEMAAYSTPLVPNQLSWWLLSSFNNFYILYALGTAQVGLYTASMRIPTILTVLCHIFSQAWLLSVLRDYGSKENTNFIRSVYRRFFSVLVVMTGVFILSAYPLAKLLLKGDFSSSWYIIPFLFISVFHGALSGFYGSIFSAEKKNKILFVSTLFGASISVILVILFIKDWGLSSVSLAAMIGYFVVCVMRSEMVKKYIDIGLKTRIMFLQTAILAIEAVCVMNECYMAASVAILSLMVINYRQLLSMFVYVKDKVPSIINRVKKH